MMVFVDLEENDDCVLVDEDISKTNPIEVGNVLNFKKKLIFQVRKHSLLYDNKHKHFSDVAKKDLVWQRIAKKLKSTDDDCKDTWFELRYNYQRYARRLRNYIVDGHKENRKRPAMHLEKELIFLWRFVENRKTCKIPYEIDDDQSVGESELEIIVIDEDNVTQPDFIRKQRDIRNTNQKLIDDDIIFVEQPVELIVIDEDDDNGGKSDKPFKINNTLKLLITQIKNYPELYNSSHLLFKDYARKSCIWNSIANSLGDKATKLMKSWIIVQTRYEWEISQPTITPSELQNQLDFLKGFILNNRDTVYKQSYYLKSGWFDPIDYFKDIYNLIVRMKKKSDMVQITDSLLMVPEKSKQYFELWTDIAHLKGTSAGQCEVTWLTMRYFYWELLHMRQQCYQLTDKWYFETIITELYAISKAAQTAKELLAPKPNKSTKKANKRSAETNATALGAPSATRPSLTSPTNQTTPTIVNNFQNTASITNSTFSSSSIAGTTFTLPKITAAISLAPQALNTGSLQIKQISGPPTLSPAPRPYITSNAMAVSAALPTPTAAQSQLSTSFGLPAQTQVTSITMPPLRPFVGSNAPADLRTPLISVRPFSVLGSPPPITWPTAPIANINNTLVSPLRPSNLQMVDSMAMPQMATYPPTYIPGSSNSNTSSCIATTTTTTITQPITSFSATASPLNSTLVSSTTIALANNSFTETAPLSTTAANTSELPKIIGAMSLLNPNEILIELIASPNGNQLLVHGPSLNIKYQLAMPLVAKFIREVLAIPLLHNKQTNPPSLVYYWEHIATKFNLPIHICRACWNFLLENFNHFPQIAPLKDLMRPFRSSLNVWKESFDFFRQFDKQCVANGWIQYMDSMPDYVECISGYPILYKDVADPNSNQRPSEMETLCAWRTISLRFIKIREIEDIWIAIKTSFCQYMTDLEFGIDNKWPLNWWRTFARMKFLVQTKYSLNDPFYYIVSNKMIEEIDRNAMLEMRNKYSPTVSTEPHSSITHDETIAITNAHDEKIAATNTHDEKIATTNTHIGKMVTQLELNDTKNNELMSSLLALSLNNTKEVELSALMAAILKYPIIYSKGDTIKKYEAWKEVGKELHMEVTDCLLTFKHATDKYFVYRKQDSVSRCRINERYYKKLDDIVRGTSSIKYSKHRVKLNIRTPFELNQSLEGDNSGDTSSDMVFPERYISDISMSNSPSNLVVKNWVFALGNITEPSNSRLKKILQKYLPNVK